ncbi:POT-type proton-dependent oligopeptide transporter [Gemmata sp.]|uniref:POT-type proton-dependent oligopeptide transporter n=1 Tax=Gemmata sp. TaxID=1914242 RepID=UPI003F706ECA
MSTAATTAPPVPTGHPTGFWFFFWGEFAERCSYYGMRAILALYMTERLGVDKADAGTFMSLFIAACYFFPLIGGYIADNFLGKYWTIVGFSIPYVIAQFLVGIEDKYVVFLSLVLLAMGSGVIKPNISTLMGLTYDQQRPGQDQLRTSAFSWFYMSINFGAALSQFGMPYLRTEYGYKAAFLFPAVLMALALVIFALGKRFYARESIERKVVGTPGDTIPDGATLTGIPVKYTVVTAEEKAADRALKLRVLGRIGSVFLMVMAFWAIFDQSASTWIFFADTYMDTTIFGVPTSADAIQAFNPVFIVLLVPVSVWLFKTLDQNGYKVKATHKMALGFALTGVSMVIMSVAGFLAGQKQDAVKLTTPEGSVILAKPSVELDKVQKPASGTSVVAFDGVQIAASDWEYDKEKKKLSFAAGTVSLKGGSELPVAKGHLPATSLPAQPALASGGVLESFLKSGDDLAKVKPEETKATLEMVEWVKPAERVTVWWQVLAFLIITVAEILISVTGLELAFVAAPQSMKSFVTACWLAVVFLANLLINAPITRLYPHMAPGVYFAGLAGAMAVVTLVFIPVGIRFNRGMAQAAAEEKEKAAREANTEAV